MKRISVFLIAVALIAGTVGCAGNSNGDGESYTLSISSTAGGAVAEPGEGTFTYDEGTVVDLVATPDADFSFVNWTGNVTTVSDVNMATTKITVNDNYSITANFIPGDCHKLTISSTEGGEVITPGEGTFTVEAGSVVLLEAQAEENYSFIKWTGDVGTVADVNDATTAITMNSDYSVSGNFEAIYTLTVSSTAGGNVTTPGEGSFMYGEGVVVDLVAEADECYRFVNWTGDVDTVGKVTAAVSTISMSGNYFVTANFEGEEVVFPDANLEAAIREAIGKPTGPIYCSDLSGLTSLSANERNIADLTGLEYCTGLIVVYLYNNQISDISPLGGLTSLQALHVDANQISDISPLGGLTSLSILYLGSNQISDVSPLGGLTSLSYLYVGSNQISDIEALVDNPGLDDGDKVYLYNNPLNENSINIYIPELEARGVDVYY